jgi:hypothetical protein
MDLVALKRAAWQSLIVYRLVSGVVVDHLPAHVRVTQFSHAPIVALTSSQRKPEKIELALVVMRISLASITGWLLTRLTS